MSKKFSRLGVQPAGSESREVRESVIGETSRIAVYEADADLDLADWVRENKTKLRERLDDCGALLLRSEHRPDFDGVARAFAGQQVDYKGGAAIRSRVDASTYTASEYPQELDIRLHPEFCYSADWPMLLFFHCDTAPTDRGQTPLADNRRILADLDPKTRDLFRSRELTYMRGYGFNRTWQRSYETDSRAEVEALCAAEDRECEWLDDDRLRTFETRPATAYHPTTGDEVWFNFVHGFHISRMDDGVRQALSTSPEDTDEQLWPNNVYWDDRSEIDARLVDDVQRTVESNVVQFDWRVGDTLIVDNMLCSHGRRPFSGPRRILLKMGDSYRSLIGDER